MMNLSEIMETIPHRFPMLLVDRVLEMEKGNRIVAIKNVTINEAFFQGHFPDNPVLPGVLIIEGMAQAGGVLAMKSKEDGPANTYFMSIDKVKFRKPVVPGDQLRYEVEILQLRKTACKFKGRAFVGDDLAAEAEFMAMITDKEI
jgi:beta-hydroxyacyl-ACP dehydratase FabZ